MPNPRPMLDPAAQAFVMASGSQPSVRVQSPDAQRVAFADRQRDARRNDTAVSAMVERWVTVATPDGSSLRIRIVQRCDLTSPSAPVLYLHGGGWVTGDASTHDRIVCELAVKSRAAVIFPEYALSPEVRYPIALEQAYAAAEWVTTRGEEHGLDPTRLAIAGDSEGANLALSVVLLALQRNSFRFRQLVAFTPVTDADFTTPSYRTFAEGYGLRRDAMQWYWDQYVPDPHDRGLGTVCPLRANSSDLARFPPSLIITAEADVVRDEGEAFAARLRLAGSASTAVRYEGMIHDFVVLTALKNSNAAKAAIAQGASALAAAVDDPSRTGL
jgi:acetyl esterase/lipase